MCTTFAKKSIEKHQTRIIFISCLQFLRTNGLIALLETGTCAVYQIRFDLVFIDRIEFKKFLSFIVSFLSGFVHGEVIVSYFACYSIVQCQCVCARDVCDSLLVLFARNGTFRFHALYFRFKLVSMQQTIANYFGPTR